MTTNSKLAPSPDALVAALKPFAREADNPNHQTSRDDELWTSWSEVTIGDFRKAKDALASYRAALQSAASPVEQPVSAQSDGSDEVEIVRMALNDWANSYADDMADSEDAKAAVKRIGKHGTLAYIGRAQIALSKIRDKLEEPVSAPPVGEGVREALEAIQKSMAEYIHLANYVGINDADGVYLAHAMAVEEQARAALAHAEPGAEPTQAARDVVAERRRQVEAEGWTPEHDDAHDLGELARTAVCYITGNKEHWPWHDTWWKPKGRRQNLIRAGALILAEIERLDRAATTPKVQS